MPDDELRSLQRRAAEGDPQAQARLRQHLCRVNGHTWNHYKGGEYRCAGCGARTPNDPREAGAKTLMGGEFSLSRIRMMAQICLEQGHEYSNGACKRCRVPEPAG